MNVVRYTRYARPQATHPAYYQIDPDAGLAGLVQRPNDFRVGQRVELGDDMRRLALGRELGLAGNHVEHAFFQGKRRMQQLFHAQGLAHADQLAEQLADVFAQGIIGCQQTVVGVELGVARMVVTGAQVRVAHDLARLTT